MSLQRPVRAATARTEPGPRRRRWIVFPLTIALVMGCLLWAVDWVARSSAQALLASSIQTQTGTSEAPTVRVGGFFFLPQVIRGRYDSVQIGIVDLAAGPLRIASLNAQLNGVRVPFHDVLVGSADYVTIGSAAEQALITFTDLNAYLESIGRSVRVEPGDDGDVRLTATVELLGRVIAASADAEISAADGAVAIRPTRLNTDSDLDASSETLLGRRLTIIIPMDPLPFGQRITDISAVDSGLLVNAAGSNVVITDEQDLAPGE